MTPDERAELLESNEKLASVHKDAGDEGQTRVIHHFFSFSLLIYNYIAYYYYTHMFIYNCFLFFSHPLWRKESIYILFVLLK